MNTDSNSGRRLRVAGGKNGFHIFYGWRAGFSERRCESWPYKVKQLPLIHRANKEAPQGVVLLNDGEFHPRLTHLQGGLRRSLIHKIIIFCPHEKENKKKEEMSSFPNMVQCNY